MKWHGDTPHERVANSCCWAMIDDCVGIKEYNPYIPYSLQPGRQLFVRTTVSWFDEPFLPHGLNVT